MDINQINQMEKAYDSIIENIKNEYEIIVGKYNIPELRLVFLDNIKYRVRYNRDLPVDAYDLRVEIIDDNGMAKIAQSDMVVMTDKIKDYIKHNEGLTIKMRAKFRFVLRFEVGHYLYMKRFETDGETFEVFAEAMDRYENELNSFNELCAKSEFTTRERITKYCEIDFNKWSLDKVGLDIETLIEFDNNIIRP